MYGVVIWVFGGAAFACDQPSETHQVASAIDEALEQYRELEIDKFKAEVSKAKVHIACLDTFISRHHAAEFHRAEGIRLFVDQDAGAAQKHFAAARALEPNYTFPSDLVPVGNPLLEDYRALEPQPGAFDDVPRPTVGTIKLDGSTTLKRGMGRPVVFQLADGSGKVTNSVALGADDAVPSYESEGTDADPEAGDTSGSDTKSSRNKAPKERKDKKAKKGPSVPLLAVAGVAALAAGGMYAGAFVTKGKWNGVEANSNKTDEVNSARSVTNGLVVGSWIAGGVAVGVGTTAFVVNGRF